MIRLGVNIDHVATLRQARKEGDPDLCAAARDVLEAGADSITVHLREDRRHIQDEDLAQLMAFVPKLNLEMAATESMVRVALETRPWACCLVPEKREELTTEGGLDVAGHQAHLAAVVARLKANGIFVSVFIDPDSAQLEAAQQVGANAVELHTGTYARLSQQGTQETERERLVNAAELGHQLGLAIHAGHGLNRRNVGPIVQLPHLQELNIGHSIVSQALFVGLRQAVREMKSLVVL
ncbi:MAG: pyridoxine 5'-phosphate synthase [Candidatus Margulisiibacteriota bacterium]